MARPGRPTAAPIGAPDKFEHLGNKTPKGKKMRRRFWIDFGLGRQRRHDQQAVGAAAEELERVSLPVLGLEEHDRDDHRLAGREAAGDRARAVLEGRERTPTRTALPRVPLE